MKVYVAAASSDLERAESWMSRLAAAGIIVTSDWAATIRAGSLEGNPRGASRAQRRGWTEADLAGVARADLVWFLVHDSAPARGAYFECGYARGLGKLLVFSGDTKQSIFSAIGEEYASDGEAFAAICRMANEPLRDPVSRGLAELRDAPAIRTAELHTAPAWLDAATAPTHVVTVPMPAPREGVLFEAEWDRSDIGEDP